MSQRVNDPSIQDVEINPVYIPLVKNQDRYLILYGSAGSGKSIFTAQKILLRVVSETPHRFLVIRKYAVTLRESVFKLFKSLIADMGLTSEFTINKTEKVLLHLPTGNEIICEGLDDPEKLKSITDITGVWVEEATELNEDDFDQIDLRVRGETKHYKQIILSFNPIDERHWIKRRFFDSEVQNCTTLRTTYEDNYFIDEEYKRVLETKAAVNPNYYRIYKLGYWGRAEIQRPYCHNFDRAKHVGEAKFDPSKQVRIGLDFNISPFVAIMQQTWEDSSGIHQRYFKEIVINNGDLQEMASRIKESLPQISLANALFTGDATARKREISQRNNVSNWLILQKLLNISPQRLQVPRANPSVSGTRPLVNLALNIMDIKIDPSLSLLINELQYTEADEEGNIIKKTRDKMEQRADALDVFRYFITTWHMNLEKKLR